MGNVPAISVTKTGGCPICGHKDWCFWQTYEDQQTGFSCQMITCQRDKAKTNIVGHDGIEYVYKFDRKSGASAYISREADEERKRMWKEAKGYNTTGSKEKKPFKPAVVAAPITKKPEKKVPPLPDARINELARYMMSLLKLDDIHAEFYLKEQKWSRDMLAYSQMKSVPEDFRPIAARIEKKFGKDCLLGYPGAYVNQNGEWDFLSRSGVLIPVYNCNGEIFRQRIRRDFLDASKDLTRSRGGELYYTRQQAIPRVINGKAVGVLTDADGHEVTGEVRHFIKPMKGVFLEATDEATHRRTLVKDKEATKGGKYIWMSAQEHVNEKTGNIIFRNGCSTENEPGLFTKPGDNMAMCFIIEGELKCMITNFTQNAPCISLPGVGCWESIFRNGYIDHLRKHGTQLFIVGFDADKATNDAVLRFEQLLIERLKSEGLPTAVVYWDPNDGKGIDDVILSGGKLLYRGV